MQYWTSSNWLGRIWKSLSRVEIAKDEVDELTQEGIGSIGEKE